MEFCHLDILNLQDAKVDILSNIKQTVLVTAEFSRTVYCFTVERQS